MESEGPKDSLVVLLALEEVLGIPEDDVVSVDAVCKQIKIL